MKYEISEELAKEILAFILRMNAPIGEGVKLVDGIRSLKEIKEAKDKK